MKVFDAGEGRVLVVKEEGQVHAMGTKCTHYGAPLSSGIFCKGKVYCPWHGACFNSKTGNIYLFNNMYVFFAPVRQNMILILSKLYDRNSYSRHLGDIEEFPALDPIPVYPVRVDPATNEVKVKISASKNLNARSGVKPLSKATEGNEELVLIIGSGKITVYPHHIFFSYANAF